MRRCLCAVLAVCLILLLIGCWSYRGLSEMMIMAGMAADGADDGQYLMTFEAMDLTQPTKTTGPGLDLAFTRGGSMFEAIRNTKHQLANKLHFGNMQIMVISHQIAERGRLDIIPDPALHGSEMHKTTELVVPREETARAILDSGERSSGAVSYGISWIVRESTRVTGSLYSAQFCRVYNDFKILGMNVALPAFYLASESNSEEKRVEAYGCAVSRSSLLAGILSSKETEYMLMVNGPLTGGVLTLYEPGITQDDISLEIKKVRSFMPYDNNNGKITMKLGTKINARFVKFPHDKNGGDSPILDRVEKSAEELVRESLRNVIKKLQTQYQSDVLGMGSLVYRTNLPLWRQISGQWSEMYQTFPVDITAKIYLANTVIVREQQKEFL